MITPSFGLTATERALPKLALDFTTASLDSRITFSRSGNTATRVNSFGYIETVNADVPRFDYNPITLACNGLLIEEAATNVLRYSEDLSQSVWANGNSSETLSSVLSPNGTTNAYKLVESSDVSAVQHTIEQYWTMDANTTACQYIFAKAGERSSLNLVFGRSAAMSDTGSAIFNLANGTITSNANGKATIQAYPNGWYRCSIVGTKNATTGNVYLTAIMMSGGSTSYIGDGTSGLYLWGAQRTATAFPLSYIPTDGTSGGITRNADVATMTGTNFSSWFNASEGTFGVSFSLSAVGVIQHLLAASIDNTTNSLINYTCVPSSSRFQYRVNDATGVNTGAVNYTSLGTPQKDILYKVFMSYKTDNFGVAMNGNPALLDSSGLYSGVANNMKIGARYDLFSSQFLNGTVSKLYYYPQALTQNEICSFSK